jgi:L-malate glycosyltransferase
VEKFGRNDVRRNAIRTELGLDPQNVLIGMVSNLRTVKGLHDFVEAARSVAEQYPLVRFVVIGEGPLQHELERMIADYGLTGTFTLLGRQSDIPGYLSSFDIAVHTSESEGFSNSVLEYLGAGLPVVATNVGGNAEALADAGVLVAPKDPAALAEALKSIMADPVRRAALGEAASARATMFASGPTRERLLQTYSKILQT